MESLIARTDAPDTAEIQVYNMPSGPIVNMLLVDDQEKNLLALEAVLGGLGQNIVKARNGSEALRCLLEQEFAVILMDVHMPDMDGFETAALIRQRDRSRDTPIIFMTAFEKDEIQIFKGYSLGAVDYLFKPIVPHILQSKVTVFVELFQKRAQVEQQAALLRETQRREHEHELAEQKRRWEIERLREEAAREKRITEALTQKAAELAQTIAERTRAEEQLRRRARQQHAVARLGQQALAGGALQELLEGAVACVAETLEVSYCRVIEQAEDGKVLALRAEYGWEPQLEAQVSALEANWITAKALLTNEPVIIEDLRNEAESDAPAIYSERGVASSLTVVIQAAKRPFGVLEASTTTTRSFTKDDIHFLQAIANVLATAIQRKCDEELLAEIRDELADQLSDMTTLHERSSRLSNNRELQPILSEVLDAITTMQETDLGVLYLHDAERGELEPAVGLGLGEGFTEQAGRLSSTAGAAGASLLGRTSVVATDLDDEPLLLQRTLAQVISGVHSVACTPLVTSSGQPIGLVAAYFVEPGQPSRRCTRLAELYARQAADFIDNARLNREIREADRRKGEFLAMLGHELRNPLAPIVNSLSILRLSEDNPATSREALEIVERQVRHLARLVDDLLDVSRISSGKIQLRRGLVDLGASVTRAVETARPLIEARRQEFSLVLPDEPMVLEADAARIEQVISNLLNNAAKYTEPLGHISLEVTCEEHEVTLRVRDTGIGMTPEVLARVFDLFAQADRSLDRAEGGLGIGLTLVRRLVELHGGTVTASSAGLGLGSEFVVRLPRTTLAASRVAGLLNPPADVADEGEAPAPKRILVVDDNIDGARTLSRLLKVWGHEVLLAHDGPTAIETARSHHPDVVVLDIGLPGMDGYQVAQNLRNEPGMDCAMLLAVTGYGRGADHLRSRQAGISHHLVKPVDLEALKRLLRNPCGLVS